MTTRYSTFTGGFGVIVAALGVAGLFISSIPELFVLGVDAVCGILFAAGGIVCSSLLIRDLSQVTNPYLPKKAWAVGLKGISCTDDSTENYKNMALNGLINEGTLTTGDEQYVGVGKDSNDWSEALGQLKGNCQKGMADEIVQFLCFGVAVGLVALGYVRMRKGGKTGGYIA